MTSNKLRIQLGRFIGQQSGAAAVEFAIWLLVLVPALTNGADLALYAYNKTQVVKAAQSAAEAGYAAWSTCRVSPPTTNCSTFSTSVSNAVKNSSYLGSKTGALSTVSGSDTAQYYCPSNSGILQPQGNSSVTCTSGATSGYYYPVYVRFTFTPLFPAASIMSFFSVNTITAESMIRLS